MPTRSTRQRNAQSHKSFTIYSDFFFILRIMRSCSCTRDSIRTGIRFEHRTFDSDYLTRHNRKYHADRLKKHQHIPYKNAGAPANPFQVSNRHISIYIIYIFNINHLRYSKIEIITPPARRAWRSYKFASLDFSGVFFGVRSWAAAHGCYCCA